MANKFKEIENRVLESDELYSYDKRVFIDLYSKAIVEECLALFQVDSMQSMHESIHNEIAQQAIKKHFGIV